jgi:hypothetical protein
VTQEQPPDGPEGPGPVAGAPSDNETLTAVLRGLADQGFTCDLFAVTDPPGFRCGSCHEISPVGDFDIVDERRMEGASDPADMVLVVAATCPRCGAKGAAALGYGPDADAADSDVVALLP